MNSRGADAIVGLSTTSTGHRMKRAHRLIAAAFVATLALPTHAGPYQVALGSCMADRTTGKDRKELAQWMFSAMAAHPSMRNLSNIDLETRRGIDQAMGRLVTRLVTEDCAKEARELIDKEGGPALGGAFEALGRTAMQELMSDRGVAAAVGAFDAHLDKAKVAAALAPQ
jgi:hypothetical protein